jgi:histone deacetylase 1/2
MANNADAPTVPRVVYVRDDASGLIDFSQHVPQHAMKPFRILPTHALVDALGLSRHMLGVRPPLLPLSLLADAHTAGYLAGLEKCSQRSWDLLPVTAETLEELGVPLTPDCPLVEGILEYSCFIASGSLFAAQLINAGTADIVIHWAGGMHHARASECSGFCYINDINVAIRELLKRHHRVLYIDLDVHHGDGVEEAFAFTDRVFCLSLHKFGESFFPGTGHFTDIGFGAGRYYTLNVPLMDGIADTDYVDLFQFTLDGVVARYQPEAIVLQCGADSLAGDRVGVFNLSSVGHGRCVELVKQVGVPLIALGGGGYTMRNVARLWAYETAILCGQPLPPATAVFVADAPASATSPDASAPVEGVSKAPHPKRAREKHTKRSRSPKRESDTPGHHASTTQLSQYQRCCIGLGATNTAVDEGGNRVPHDDTSVVQAVADGIDGTLRTVFRKKDILYVPPEEALAPKAPTAPALARLRRLIAEHLGHVTTPVPTVPQQAVTTVPKEEDFEGIRGLEQRTDGEEILSRATDSVIDTA